jgi:hypothetical protein
LALVALVALALVLPVLAFTMAAAAHGGGRGVREKPNREMRFDQHGVAT